MRRMLLALVAVVGLGVAGAPTGSVEPVAVAAVMAPVMIQEELECELNCYEGSLVDCQSGYHDAYNQWGIDANAMRNGGAHPSPPNNCFEGYCPNKHGPMCDGSGGPDFAAADLEAVRLAIRDGDAANLRIMLAAHPTRTNLNVAREAVQITDCFGSVIAHLPTSTALVREIAAD